jgi:hypothetical protein
MLVVAAILAFVAAIVLHLYTVDRIQQWQPGYPGTIVLSIVTPPVVIQAIHQLAPWVLGLVALAWAAAVRASRRDPPAKWVSPTLQSAAVALGMLLLGYAYALFWVRGVARHLG